MKALAAPRGCVLPPSMELLFKDDEETSSRATNSRYTRHRAVLENKKLQAPLGSLSLICLPPSNVRENEARCAPRSASGHEMLR